MAVTRAEKEAEVAGPGDRVPGRGRGYSDRLQGHQRAPGDGTPARELRRPGSRYKVVKNTLAKRALKGTTFEALSGHFEGTTAVAYTESDPVALAKTLTAFMKTAPALQIKAAVVQGQAIKRGRGHRPGQHAGQAGAVRQAPLPAECARHQLGARAERRAARFRERAGPGGEEAGVAPISNFSFHPRRRQEQWPSAMRIDFTAPQHVRDTIASLGRTEDVKFSPSNKRLAIAAYRKNEIAVFDVNIDPSPNGARVNLPSVVEIFSSQFNEPHGLDLLDEETIIVSNRSGDVPIFKLPGTSEGNRHELEPLAVINSASGLDAPARSP